MTDGGVVPYRLFYWPGLPGRGEFVRLVLEQAGAPYVDVGRLPEAEGGGAAAVNRALRGELGGMPLFAPPILQDGEVVLSQTVNICRYLGLRHGLWPADPVQDAHALQVQLTIEDLVHEVHATHHPVSSGLFYEQQREVAVESAARFREHRMVRFLRWLDGVLKAGGGTWMVGGALSSVDLAVFQVLSGLAYAFPRASDRMAQSVPGLLAVQARVAALPNIAAYLGSPRRLGFNETGIFRQYAELDG
jgi:glutathione S-transferase